MDYKKLNRINKRIDERHSQIRTIEQQKNYLRKQLKTASNDYERNYIKMSIGQLIKYQNWLDDEIHYLEEDRLFV